MAANLSLSEPDTGTAPDVGSSQFHWSLSTRKRLFDLALATPLLCATSPLMVLAALLIKCSSRGPVLFRQWRLGQSSKAFQLLKFRTMIHARSQAGPGLTQQGDSRIFPVGRWLRKWKLDELPQLFNVIRGEMSLVGPRPDLPEYLRTLTHEQRQILWLRPGITGAASLQFRHEEALLAQVPVADLQRFYVSHVLPEKVQIDLAYAGRATFLTDVRLLLRTAAAIFS